MRKRFLWLLLVGVVLSGCVVSVSPPTQGIVSIQAGESQVFQVACSDRNDLNRWYRFTWELDGNQVYMDAGYIGSTFTYTTTGEDPYPHVLRCTVEANWGPAGSGVPHLFWTTVGVAAWEIEIV